MSNHDRREDRKPLPPFPFDSRMRKVKRNRVRLDPAPRDASELPKVDFLEMIYMTSSAKGRGREECLSIGAHDWALSTSEGCTRLIDLVYCRRCGVPAWRRVATAA